MEFTSDSAKQFLLTKVGEQASPDGIALDEIERRMFLFSETSGKPDFEASEKFDKEYDSQAYESKVGRLLGRAYARDKKTEDGRASWMQALQALREDFYGLVMVDQAGIPRTQAGIPGADQGLWGFFLELLPLALVQGGILIVGAILIFQPSRIGLHLPDWFRLLLLPVFFWLIWYVGKIFQQRSQASRNEWHQG
jgi:hypothetical protein